LAASGGGNLVLQEGPRAHDLVLVGIIKAYSGTQPDIVMESISLLPINSLLPIKEDIKKKIFPVALEGTRGW
jgi:hypothetical protein